MIHLILALVFVIVLVRLVTLPFRLGRRHRLFGGYDGYGYGNRFGYGCGHRRGGGLFTILALVALDRLFSGRRF